MPTHKREAFSVVSRRPVPARRFHPELQNFVYMGHLNAEERQREQLRVYDQVPTGDRPRGALARLRYNVLHALFP